MYVLLPFFALLTIGLCIRQVFKQLDLRFIILLASSFWGILLTLLTEVLSLLKIFSQPALAISWGVIALSTGIWAAYHWKKPASTKLPRLSLLSLFHFLGIVGIAGLTGLIALIAAPNNWDSMVYHLSRVMHWLQNDSVAFYPTNIVRQLYLPPWSEYFLAHLQSLGGSDRFSQLPQWLAMVGSVMGVSLIAKQLGARQPGQILAAFVTATLPMGILQATTTQNDYIVTYWLISLVAFLLQGLNSYQFRWNVAIGAALGLSLLTKSTAYVFAFPFVLFYGISGLKHQGIRFWKAVLAITIVVCALNLPHFSRNIATFGHPLGPQDEVSRYHNETFSLKGTASNILRNLGLYAGSVEPLNKGVNQAIQSAHDWMGLEVNDPRFTWSDHVFSVSTPSFHEDTTGSGMHLLLVVISFIVLLIKKKEIEKPTFLVYGLLLFTAFLLFCGYLRWQTWHPRLHLPLLALSCALVGLMERSARTWIIWAISLVLAAQVLLVFYFNPNKPLVADYNIFNLPRREVMIMRKNLVVPYIEGVNYLLNEECYQVGLYIPNEEWEYPFWSLYQDSGKPYRLEHINVTNASKDIPSAPFSPCAILSTQPDGDEFILEGGQVYYLNWSMTPVSIYTQTKVNP